MLRRLAVLALLVVACRGGAAPTSPPSTHPEPTKAPAAAGPEAPIGFEACAAGPCMVQARTGAYHECLHATDGQCINFGAACVPADACMYDPGSRSYRSCTAPLADRCATFAAACTPTATCLLDPASGKHRRCDQPTAGGCGAYGEVCDPT